MSNTDIDRLRVIRNVLDKKLTQLAAAAILDLGDRQVRRLCVQVRSRGNRGILHGLLGRSSNNQCDPELLGMALSAIHNPRWQGFTAVFAQQKLESLHGIVLSDTTVRKLMTMTELWQRRRPKARHRAWRERRDCVGMLIQLDGSEHDWFEGRGPKCALLVYIDDATSRILHAEFVTVEDTFNLMRSTEIYLRKHGRCVAFYVDKDSIYKVNRQATIDEELRDSDPITQFTRAMTELGIEVIPANSPQAKGRVERSFDTHQDRLIKELRLANINDMAAGNIFLRTVYIDDHNRRFAVDPANNTDAHRPLLADHRLDQILSRRTTRSIANDYTVRFEKRFFQLFEDQPVRVGPKDKIEVEIRLDGTTHLRAKGTYLRFKTIEKRPYRPHLVAQPSRGLQRDDPRTKGVGSTPAKDHPWRRLFLNGPHRVGLAPSVLSKI
ncbi:MAG: ISNCY family transposase [Elusimicrobiota bacterium]|nr:ISNCY family transposase [Elusimicrobiota bacterium]